VTTDELRIDTPEQIALELPIAGIGSRFLAIVLDTLLQLFSYGVGAGVLAYVATVSPAGLTLPPALAAFLPAIALLLGFCIYWGYFAFFEIIWKGQTPGKRLAGIRVIKDSGRPVDALSAILRNLLRGIDMLPVMYAAGITCMILNRHSRRLGDLVAGTVVVHDKPPARIDAQWSVATETGGSAPVAAGPYIARLTDAEVVLVETYLERRLELDWEARERARDQIARRVAERTTLTPEPGQSVDDFLESVARQARDSARLR
jgi:uncharacterized RDD family membrane protein YckC